jgi:anti-sigma regulatory factor (Ser/Thr protein kinase)
VRELSLHILDIAENAIAAGADTVDIRVAERPSSDNLAITIRDNGRGMPPDKLRHLDDPFVTTRKTRRVGLGLSLLAAAAKRCEGDLTATVEHETGTTVTAVFRNSHIDRAPLGDIAGTLALLIVGNPYIDFIYTHSIENRAFILDTRRLKSEGLELRDPLAAMQLQELIRRSLVGLAGDADAHNGKETHDA